MPASRSFFRWWETVGWDPKGRPLEEARATREEIGERVAALVAELDRSPASEHA